jgi:hypothetical protein
VRTTVRKKYNNREKRFHSEYEKIEGKLMQQSDIKELFECGVYDRSTVGGLVDTYRYPRSFLDILEYFIKYELALDNEAQETFQKWKK